jgi:glutamate N-acetyltransferase/amino-acid N-acetyltransferase
MNWLKSLRSCSQKFREQAMPDVQPVIEKVNGFKVAGVHCGLKKDGKLDFALIVSDTPSTAAGVFTTNQVKAAPVLVDMERLNHHPHRIRAVAINTASANACTGQQGMDNALQTARWVAEEIGCSEDEVLVMSTGVIGIQLPMEKIKHGVQLTTDSLGDNWEATARAIMTTDTRPKMASLTSSQGYQVAGIAKGAGMIAPNMATMLSVVVTDVGLEPTPASAALRAAMSHTFNRISVDGDTSTNDTVLLLANGASGVHTNQPDLYPLCRKLAQDIVRDGEGVTKFITLNVTGASSDQAAHQIANTIAVSPLVKTAFYGGDANWGRIMMAAGRAGIPLQPEKIRLWIAAGETPADSCEELLIFSNGIVVPYSEAEATRIFHQPAISIKLDCGLGNGSATVWTCDLSHDYVSINGDYRS